MQPARPLADLDPTDPQYASRVVDRLLAAGRAAVPGGKVGDITSDMSGRRGRVLRMDSAGGDLQTRSRGTGNCRDKVQGVYFLYGIHFVAKCE